MDAKEDLIESIQEVLGRLPAETRLLIKILAHPDVIAYTNRYFSVLDPRTMCLTYEAPWNCVKEAEARYQTIHEGWLGGIGIDTSWCENCRKKVMTGE